MSDLGKHNQKMKSHLGGKKVRSLSEIRDSEPPTFSPISIMDNPEIFPFLEPLAPRRIHHVGVVARF